MSLKLEVNILRNTYFGLFILGVGLVVLMHIFDRPALDWFRVPTFIKAASEVNGLSYFPTFKIYQFTLVFSLVSILLDGICLTKFKSKLFVKLSEWTSFFGGILMLLTLVYFLYNLFTVGNELLLTNLIFVLFSTFLVAVDLTTFRVDRVLEAKKNV